MTTENESVDKNKNNKNNMMSMSIDIEMVHRILLCDPSDFSSLTSNTKNDHPTPTFQEFRQRIINKEQGQKGSNDPINVMKRAYHDNLVQGLSSSSSSSTTKTTSSNGGYPNQYYLERIKQLLLELHTSIRQLVPNRVDLHSLLIDDRILPTVEEDDGKKSPMIVILSWIIEAGQALVQLESVARSETTLSWIQLAKDKFQLETTMATGKEKEVNVDLLETTTTTTTKTINNNNNNNNKEELFLTETNHNFASFLVMSLMYLMYKVELCESDKNQFYLSHVIAPKIYHSGEGIDMERQLLQQKYPGLQLFHTQEWIQSLVTMNKKKDKEVAAAAAFTANSGHHDKDKDEDEDEDKEDLNEQQHHHLGKSNIDKVWEHKNLLQIGWIEILFQKTKQTIIPEILMLDIPNLQTIRTMTRLATAGCALGLHACNVAKRNPNIILQQEESIGKGKHLVQAMMMQNTRNRNPAAGGGGGGGGENNSSMIEYEQGVEQAVLELAQGWKESSTSLDATEVEFLQGRTRSVLRGEDPVIQLLDSRMKEIFCELAMSSSSSKLSISEEKNDATTTFVPMEMRSGRQMNNDLLPSSVMIADDATTTTSIRMSPFLIRAQQLFRDRGLALFAMELAKAAELAIKVIDLAWKLYGEDILEKMFLDVACET